MASLPIVFIDLDGKPTTDVVSGAPCISLGLYYEPGPSDLSPKMATRCWALLDTGADHIYADATLLKELGAAIVGGAGNVNGEGPAAIHQANLVFETTGDNLPAHLIARDFRREGRTPYQIVLGRNFLKIGHLHFDFQGAGGQFSFESPIGARSS